MTRRLNSYSGRLRAATDWVEPVMSVPKIILLVGPKGAGKTYLALQVERDFGVPFVHVEKIWLDLMKERAAVSEGFDIEGQARVVAAIRQRLANCNAVVLESTGTAPWFAGQLSQLRKLGHLILVRVSASLDLCADRVRMRDQAQHINVSDDRVAEINALAAVVDLNWDIEFINDGNNDPDGFLAELSQFL